MISLSVGIVGLLCILGQASALDEGSTGLIVNGRDAPRGKYPFQILLFEKVRRGKYFICGGSILNKDYVLTAAHCLTKIDPEKLEVAVGKRKMDVDVSETQYFDVQRVINHEDYNRRTNANDIAILKLKTEITFGDIVQPVNLAPSGQNPSGKMCYASGFGEVNERTGDIADTLQELRTRVLTSRKCKRFARKFGGAASITDQVVCTKDKKAGVCSGDSGGPLGCFDSEGVYTQYGLLSWGSTKCVQGFNVFTRVSEYSDWITANS